MTVNKALSELAQADLIERRRRAGSFVRRPQHLSAVLKIADIRAEITALGRGYGYELIGRKLRAATAADRERLGVKKAGKVVAITCRHSADKVPFAVEDRLIDLSSVPDAATADFSREPPGSWLLHHVPWTEAEHTISAIVADDRTAAALDIAVGAPCLVIDRYTWRSARTITAVRLLYPGDSPPCRPIQGRLRERCRHKSCNASGNGPSGPNDQQGRQSIDRQEDDNHA